LFLLNRTEKILEDIGDSVQPPPRAGSVPEIRPIQARVCRSDIVIEEGESSEDNETDGDSKDEDKDRECSDQNSVSLDELFGINLTEVDRMRMGLGKRKM
jgi:hypothetical protein